MISLTANGQKYSFTETKQAPGMIKEIFNDNYTILKNKVEFRHGDVILDAGANEGMFSILMAKTFPMTRIIALEPVPDTYSILRQNLRINEIYNVEAYNVGLGAPGQGKATLTVSKDYSGGSTKWCTFNPEHHRKVDVELISLDTAFERYQIGRCRLMKIDIEGMEYEALYPSTVLDRVDMIVGEFHTNRKLDFESRRVDGLVNWVAKRTKILHIQICGMAE